MMLGTMGIIAGAHTDFKTRWTEMTVDGVTDIRGFQIRDWLLEHPKETKWMILDDDSDFTPEQKSRHLHTDALNGILVEHHERALTMIDAIYKGKA